MPTVTRATENKTNARTKIFAYIFIDTECPINLDILFVIDVSDSVTNHVDGGSHDNIFQIREFVVLVMDAWWKVGLVSNQSASYSIITYNYLVTTQFTFGNTELNIFYIFFNCTHHNT